MVIQLHEIPSEITEDELRQFSSDYFIPLAMHPEVPDVDACIEDFPKGKVGVYTRFLSTPISACPIHILMRCIKLLSPHPNLPASLYRCCQTYKLWSKLSLLAIDPTVQLFCAFYHSTWSNGWVTFSKRAGRLQCYSEKLDALRNWREKFFWVDSEVFPWNYEFYT